TTAGRIGGRGSNVEVVYPGLFQLALPNFTFFVRLPKLIGTHIQAGKPATVNNCGINTNGISYISNRTFWLRGMAANHSLAGLVSLDAFEVFQEYHPVSLFLQIQIGMQTSMNKYFVLRLEGSDSPLDKRPVRGRN